MKTFYYINLILSFICCVLNIYSHDLSAALGWGCCVLYLLQIIAQYIIIENEEKRFKR